MLAWKQLQRFAVTLSSGLLALIFLLILTAASCETIPDPKPEIPDDTKDCYAAFVNLQKLECVEAVLPDGTPFDQYCEDVQRNGHALNPSCLKTIKGCDEIELVCDQ